jgi:glycosyltransferase involved in cell wall biosynthesis
MKNVLYIGNNLAKATANLSAMQSLGPLLEAEGHTLRYASSQSHKGLRLLDMILSCMRYKNTTDLVLIDTYSTQNFYYAYSVAWLCKFLSLPYAPILHGGNLPQRLVTHPKQCKALFENAHINIAPSVYMQQAFETKGYTNVIHISNSIDIAQYPLNEKVYDSPKLLWVRSFAQLYNPTLAVKVLALLREIYPNATLCMVGPDSDGSLAAVKALAKELNVSVSYTGKLTKAQWITLSKDFNIFINTTNFDNMPVSVMEAMALGFPVVSTNVGGLPFLIEDSHNGVLVAPNDEQQMTQAIIRLMQDPAARDTIIDNARRTAEQLDWGQVKTRWKKVLS